MTIADQRELDENRRTTTKSAHQTECSVKIENGPAHDLFAISALVPFIVYAFRAPFAPASTTSSLASCLFLLPPPPPLAKPSLARMGTHLSIGQGLRRVRDLQKKKAYAIGKS